MDPRDIDQMEVGGAVQLPPPISEVTEEEETRGGNSTISSHYPS